MTGFSEEVKRQVYAMQNGYCLLCLKPIDDFHHKLPQTKANIKRFPLFIHSPFNCAGLSRDCHIDKKHFRQLRITLQMAQVYENWLKSLINFGMKEE